MTETPGRQLRSRCEATKPRPPSLWLFLPGCCALPRDDPFSRLPGQPHLGHVTWRQRTRSTLGLTPQRRPPRGETAAQHFSRSTGNSEGSGPRQSKFGSHCCHSESCDLGQVTRPARAWASHFVLLPGGAGVVVVAPMRYS